MMATFQMQEIRNSLLAISGLISERVIEIWDNKRLDPVRQHTTSYTCGVLNDQLWQNSVSQGSNQVPLVSKYHHPIISFRANHTANTLSCLPLTLMTYQNLFQESLLETCRQQNKCQAKCITNSVITKASNVRKSPSFIWKVSRRYSNLASNILWIVPETKSIIKKS